MTDLPPADRFAHVRDWVFDLDNTLYPHHTNLFAQIDQRMTTYVSELLALSREEARALQKRLDYFAAGAPGESEPTPEPVLLTVGTRPA